MPETTHAVGPQKRGVQERGLLIGGKSVLASSGKLVDDVSPWNGEIYARVAAGTPEDITRAADAAEAALPAWSELGAFERREIFLTAADIMARRGGEAIAAMGQETGASQLFAGFNVALCVEILREAAKENTVSVVHLIYRSKNYESSSKDYDFSRIGMVEHWGAGERDVDLSMRHTEWLERPQTGETMITYDLTGDGS